jgi:SAM-dependent methyltransferase
MVDLAILARGLQLRSDGIWYAPTVSELSYPKEGNERCAQVEDSSFWFRHRNACILALIRAYPPSGPMFDIGGGNGCVSRAIVDAGFESVVVEPGAAGARAAKARRLEHVVCGTLEGAGFGERSLPAIGLFDVVEHIEDDLGFMRRVCNVLVNGGRVYINVPAYAWLWSDEDVAAGHCRRYTIRSMSSLLESTGFIVDFATYIFRPLPAPIFLLRALPTRLGFARDKAQEQGGTERDHMAKGGITRGFIDSLLSREVKRVEQSKAMSFGGSCLVAATKR